MLRQRYTQMLAQSSRETLGLTLALKLQPDAVQQVAPHHKEAASTSIQDAYAQAQGALLILGQPGAGKSTLLLELAVALAERVEADEIQPLPFILPLSSWDVERPAIEDAPATRTTYAHLF
ncbi:hypothetical protein KSX_62800 [Ktedonospora formicarum]|uniref:NACHT domain-containing protein n=2 Tax=Ktedonospora formicarum TaxID=2778364 RepID=A0A8J3MTD5_9CHLR|nr:hypothetical protein KSX_62800 [Ktedonospora formicarum]